MSYSRKLKYSVNPELVDKQPPSNKLFFSKEFHSVEGTIEELASIIHEEGWAFSYQFENGYRNKFNFVATDIACVDVDGGITLSEAQNNQFVQDHCSLLYTTPSHSLEQHRFRMVFVLPETITDGGEISAISRSLARRLGGDMAATDAARLFYGSRGCFYQLFDNSLTKEVVQQLIQDGKVAHYEDSVLNNRQTTNRSMMRLDPDTIVVDCNNNQILLKNIDTNTAVYCPFHDDKSPSAFVAQNKNKRTYIHCKTCRTTWWMDSEKDVYNFYSFEQSIEKIYNKAKNIPCKIDSPLEDYLYPITIMPKNINILNEKYFSISKLEDGITLIKSPKGTGKTTYLSEIIKKSLYRFSKLEEYESATDFETEASFYGSENILLIGHRQALIGDLCNKLDLNCYLDDHLYNSSEISFRKKRYGICLDSLQKVRKCSYDIVVIDEVEQVLGHFLSETVGEKRQGIFRLFSDLIFRAKKVVALDADLGWNSFVTLTSLTHPEYPEISKKSKKQAVQTKPVHIYINKNISVQRKVLCYRNNFHLIEILKLSVVDGKRVFVTSNSKKKINSLYHALEDLNKKNNLNKSIISITSENSRTKEVQYFIQNIKTEILKYDVVLCSPSLGTGIDITFENSAQEIDCVFGFFENRINSHFEIDQQLARVRHPKEVHVWVCPSRYYFETDIGVVISDVLHDSLSCVADDGVYKYKNKILQNIDPFYVMSAMIISNQRASKNSLKFNFINYKNHQGWSVSVVDKDESLINQGYSFYDIGAGIHSSRYVDSILQASVLNRYDYTVLKEKFESNDSEITKRELFDFKKTSLELFYRSDADSWLVMLDNEGHYRSIVGNYKQFMDYLSSLKDNGSVFSYDVNSLKYKLFKNKSVSSALMYDLLSSASLINKYELDINYIFAKSDLDVFVNKVMSLKPLISTQLGVDVRKDIEKNPTRFLTDILKTIGIEHVKFGNPKTVNNKKIYYYKLQGGSISQMSRVISMRSTSGWNYLNKKYNFTYDEYQLMYLDKLEEKYNFC